MVADLPAQVTALARLVDRTLRRVTDVETLLRQLAADIEARSTPGDGRDGTAPAQTGDRCWLLLADPDQAHTVLADLSQWLTGVYLRYPDAALPSCWLWHPAVVEELWWLRQAHRDAYSARDGSPSKIADWHDRQRPGVVKRLSPALGCELALHEQPRPAPTVPLTGAANRIAEAWTTSRTEPLPTPDELDSAEQHDHSHRRTTHR